MIYRKTMQMCVVLLMLTQLTACVGTIVGAAVDTAIEIVKVPFKVGGAVIDVVTPDDLAERAVGETTVLEHEQDAIEMESEGL